MASFFQPPADGDPTLESCATEGGFQIYCNHIVDDDGRFKHWYQILLVGVGASALFLPVLALAIEAILNLCFSRLKSKPRYFFSAASVSHSWRPVDMLT